MNREHINSAGGRKEAIMLLVKQLQESSEPAVMPSFLLDTLCDNLRNSRGICFTGLGEYIAQPE